LTSHASAAGTQSGTTISNTATANYSDGTNNYASTSNTVTTTVASISSENIYLVSSVPGNATFSTVNGGTSTYNSDGAIVTPQNTVTDSYAIQNTGNANAQVTITQAGYGAAGINGNTASAISATTPAADTAATAGTYAAYVCTSGQAPAACVASGTQAVTATGTVGATAGSFTSVGSTSTSGTLAYAVYTATTTTGVAAGNGDPQGGYVLVQFTYNVGTGVSGQNSVVPEGNASIVGNAGATSSGSGLQIPTGLTATVKSYSSANPTAAASASFVDQELADGRLDVLKAASAITNATQPITYTIDGNNGGGTNAKAVDLSAVIGTSLCGASNTKCIGFAVSDVIQNASNGNAPKVYDNLTGAGEPSGTTLAPTCPSGLTATVFFNTTATPTAGTGWAVVTPGTTNLQSAKILVLICSGTNLINQTLASNPTSSGYGSYGFADGTTGAALPTMPAVPQIVLTFSTSQASVVASGIKQPNEANSVAQNNAPTSQIVGPGTNSGTAPSTANEIAMLDNVSPQPANSTGGAASSGYSNTQQTTLIYQTISLGTVSSATATGNFSTTAGAAAYWTSGSATNNGDFSVAPILGTLSGGAYTAANGASTTNAATGVTAATTTVTSPSSPQIVHSFNNGGNAVDTFTITATQAATQNTSQPAGNATYAVTYSDASGGVCSSPATNTTISAAGVTQNVAAGGTIQYCVKYSASGTVDNFDQKAVTLTATSNSNATVSNSTNDLLIAGGYIQMNKTAVVGGTPSPNDGGTCSNANPEPGCTITYTVAWSNLAPSGATGSGNATPTVSKFTILEDGIANGWFTIGSPTTSQTTGLLTAATITGDSSGQVAYYASAQATYNTTSAVCYPTTTAASATTAGSCTSNIARASGAGALGGAYGALIYVYGNSVAGAVPNASTGSIAFPLIIRSTP
jgi:hypothetical protein